MIEGYISGDPYMHFAIASGLAPKGSTKITHPVTRDRCKITCLGILYGMAEHTLAIRLELTVAEAKELLTLHRATYRRFWQWVGDTVDTAMLTNVMVSQFGWTRRLASTDLAYTSLMNWEMQAGGSEMLRLACIMCTESDIEVCAPVHDALLVQAPLPLLEDKVALTRSLMSRAGRMVTGGLDVRTDAQVIAHPDRYRDSRGTEMWGRAMSLLTAIERDRGADASGVGGIRGIEGRYRKNQESLSARLHPCT
jgi:DNA polymerase-1